MQYYNLLIYFQSAYLVGGGDKFASPYMAFRQPLLVTILKPHNPKSFKPNNYEHGNIINSYYNFASKKGKSLKQFG